jgi:hypothetical protein
VSAADSLAIEAFRHTVEAWHDYYLLAGTAAATLMGLLFVSLSIHLEKIVDERGAHLEAMAREGFASFLIVLAISLTMLAPGLAERPIGAATLMLGAFRAGMAVTRMRRALGSAARASGFGPRVLILRFLFPLAASGFLAWAGWSFLRHDAADGMVGVMTACMLLIADAARSAYELLVRTARAEARKA